VNKCPIRRFRSVVGYQLTCRLRIHDRHDGYSIFEDEVTDKEAPGYSSVVANPMDFGKMRKKVENDEYGSGSEAVTALYNDFKLVFDNCYLYNDEGNEVTEEASRILGLLPETYVAACIHVAQHAGKSTEDQ